MPLSEATSDPMSRTAGRATPTGPSTVLSAPVQPSKHSAVPSAHQGQRGARGPTCSCVGQGRDTCPALRSVLVFSVSQGDVFLCACGFHFFWICCQERKKKESGQKQSGEPGSRFSKRQCKIVVFGGKVMRISAMCVSIKCHYPGEGGHRVGLWPLSRWPAGANPCKSLYETL